MNHPQTEQRALPGRGTGGQPVTAGERFLRISEVISLTGLGKTTIYELQKAKAFPHSIPLSGGASVAWLLSEVTSWMESRVALRNTNHK